MTTLYKKINDQPENYTGDTQININGLSQIGPDSDLTGLDLSDAILTDADLTGAVYNKNTTFPGSVNVRVMKLSYNSELFGTFNQSSVSNIVDKIYKTSNPGTFNQPENNNLLFDLNNDEIYNNNEIKKIMEPVISNTVGLGYVFKWSNESDNSFHYYYSSDGCIIQASSTITENSSNIYYKPNPNTNIEFNIKKSDDGNIYLEEFNSESNIKLFLDRIDLSNAISNETYIIQKHFLQTTLIELYANVDIPNCGIRNPELIIYNKVDGGFNCNLLEFDTITVEVIDIVDSNSNLTENNENKVSKISKESMKSIKMRAKNISR